MENKMTLEETLVQIKPLDERAMEIAAKRWDSIAKPLHSLGKMEKLSFRSQELPEIRISI